MLGVLEVAGRGSGFLRRREASYLPSHGDVHVGERLIRQFGLRTGDEIDGSVRPAAKGKSASLETITAVQGKPPEMLRERPEFSRLGAVHPNEQLRLEAIGKPGGQSDYTNRVIDLLCPLGKGQRALIVAPAKAGKTMVLQSIAQGVSANYPAADLFILLVDERPGGSLRDGGRRGGRGDCLQLRQSGPAPRRRGGADAGAGSPPGRDGR